MQSSKLPEICVIICTYNTKELTCKCLDKLKLSIGYLKKSVEVVVVENGTDGTGKLLKERYPWVKVIEPKENTGFAKGNNLGVRKSSQKAKYYLFLNTDALVKKETLAKSVAFIQSDSGRDVFGCRLILGNGKMQPSAGFLPAPFNTFLWMVGLDKFSPFPVHPKDQKFFASDRKVGWVMGAYLFMKKEVFEKTNGFDESFFMYMEEVDWCRRINKSGYNIWYTPGFEITHLDKASSNFDPTKPLMREIEGLKYYFGKYYPGSAFLMNAIIKLGVFGRWVGFSIKKDKLRSGIYYNILKVI